MPMLKNLYLICGKSGSGKTTLVDALSDKYGYSVLQSHTTRKPRHPNDTDHIYSEISDYMQAKDNSQIIAETVFDHYYYWATVQQLEQSDLYVIDKTGIESLQQKYSGDRNMVVIYIDTDSETCINRMKQRGDKDIVILDRLGNDIKAFDGIEHIADFIVDGNTEKEDVIISVTKIITDCEQVDLSDEVVNST
jgi:guanylate kinase